MAIVMSALPVASRKQAMMKQTHHQFVDGIGYVAHSGPPALLPSHFGSKNCKPPTDTVDGTMHMLQPPGKAPPMAMRWIKNEHAWASPKMAGHRLAFTCEHLMKAGWAYIGPAKT